jgi:hypothetical protein
MHDQWQSSPSNWKITLATPGQQVPCAVRVGSNEDTEYLLDYRSPSFDMLAQRLSGLEKSTFMQVVYVPRTRLAYVVLPRLRLRFTLAADGSLESNDLPSMVVDPSQSSGTFVGLRNQLVLCHKNPALRHQRCILIPHGSDICSVQQDGHVRITIDTPDIASVRYHRYDIDGDLGRLSTQSSLTSRLFKIYLHAITSSYLPDPLTRQTGVEQALWELTSAASCSSMTLQASDVAMLDLIGSLTPRREFYPAHLRCMATIHWNPAIGVFPQHSAFAGIVQSILQHSDSLAIFHDSTLGLKDSIDKVHREPLLLQRASTRSQYLYPSGMVTALHGIPGRLISSSSQDTIYTRRDTDSLRLKAAMWAVRLARTRNTYLQYNLTDFITESCSSITDPEDELQLGYHSEWLSLSPSSWLTLYDLCRQSNRFGRVGYHRLTFSLAALSYSCSEMRCLIPVGIAAACNWRLHEEAPPQWMSYELHYGFSPDLAIVVAMITDQFALPLPETPAEDLERDHDEDVPAHAERQRDLYIANLQSRALSLASYFFTQDINNELELPTPSDPDSTEDDHSRWIDTRGCLKAVSEYFTHCAHNDELRSHLIRVEAILRSDHPRAEQHLLDFDSFQAPDILDVIAFSTQDRCGSSRIPTLLDRLTGTDGHLPSSVPVPNAIHVASATDGHGLGLETDFDDLTMLVDELRGGTGIVSVYGHDLTRSLVAAKEQSTLSRSNHVVSSSPTLAKLSDFLSELKRVWQSTLSQIQSLVLAPSDSRADVDCILGVCGLLPRTTLIHMLRALTFSERSCLSPERKQYLIHLAQSIVLYQHAMRMRNLAALGQEEELVVEWKNWRANFEEETEDDLLLQVNIS